MTWDVLKDKIYNISPFYQHKLMKNSKYKFFKQRLNFYNYFNMFNIKYDPNAFEN